MIWKQENGARAPKEAVEQALRAESALGVPAGLVLAICECESNFRLGLISTSGAVGPMQLRKKFAQDFYRYADFSFDLEGWESIYGAAAMLRTYAKWAEKRGVSGENRWRWAAACYRWGQNAPQMKDLDACDRVQDVERHMKRNGVWYDGNDGQSGNIAQLAAQWALKQVGSPYSQARRDQVNVFDCSSLVARAYSAQGVDWDCVGKKIPLSCEEVYSDQFELLWPTEYSKIGKTFGGDAVINKAKQPGDLQFLCTSSKTSRANKITHVTMVASAQTIVHARGTKYGVRLDDIALYKGKVCAVCRYNPDAPLRRGMRGKRVKALQKRLNELGAGLAVDGKLGAQTEAAMQKYKEVTPC